MLWIMDNGFYPQIFGIPVLKVVTESNIKYKNKTSNF